MKSTTWKRHFLRRRPQLARRSHAAPQPARQHRYRLEAMEPRVLLDGGLGGTVASTIAGGIDDFAGFLGQLETAPLFDYTVPLLINVDDPTKPRPPTLNDMVSVYADTDNDGLFGDADDAAGLILNAIDQAFGKTDGYVTWDEVFKFKIADRIIAYLSNPANSDGDPDDEAAAFTTYLGVTLDDLDNPFNPLLLPGDPLQNVAVPGFLVTVSADYQHRDVTLSGSTMNPGQIAWTVAVTIETNRLYDIDLGRNAELFGLSLSELDAIEATAKIEIVFTFGVETRREVVVTDDGGTPGDPSDDTYALSGAVIFGGFFIDTATPYGPFFTNPGITASTEFAFDDNLLGGGGELNGRIGFLDVTFKNSTLEFDVAINTVLADPATSAEVTKPGRLDVADLGAGVATLVPESSVTRDGSLSGELKIYIDPLPNGGGDLFTDMGSQTGGNPYATLLVSAPGDDIFSPLMQPDGSTDARPAPVIAPATPADADAIAELVQFNNIGPQSVIGFLNQLAGALQGIQSSPLFTTEVPFTDGTTLGSILSLRETLEKALLVDGNTAKLLNKEGVPQFLSAQQLAGRLDAILASDIDTINATYNPATDELTYDIAFTLDLADVDKALDLNVNLGGLAGVATSAKITLGASNTLSFTLGANLKSLASITLTPTVRDQAIVALLQGDGTPITPASGVLSADAKFSLSYGSRGTIDVVLAAGNYTDRAGLASALQTAINNKAAAAALPDVTVSLIDGRLKIQSTGGDALLLRPLTAGDTSVTELGFAFAAGQGQTSTVVPVPRNGVLPGDATFSLRADGTTKLITLTGASTQNGNASIADLAADLQAAIDLQFTGITVKVTGGVLTLSTNQYSILQILAPNAVAANDLGFTDRLVASKISIPGVRELVLVAATAKNASTFNGVLSGDASFDVSINGGPAVTVNVLRVPTVDVTALGFTEGQTVAGEKLTAANTGPGAGRLGGDIKFKITIDGSTTGEVTVLRSATTGNFSVSDLAGDINDALAAVPALAGLTASVSNNRLVLTKTGATSIKIESVTVVNGSGTADNGATPATDGLDRLIADLNAALAATPYAGGTLAEWLFFAKKPNTDTPSDTDFFLTLASRPGRPVDTLAVTGGNAAFVETGFAAAFNGEVSGPRTNGQVAATARFLIAVDGGVSVPIEVTAADTAGFTSIGQLVDLLQTKVNGTSLNGKILVTAIDNRLLFSGLDPNLRLVRVTPERDGNGVLTAAGAAAEGQLGIRETLVQVPLSGAQFFVEDLGVQSSIEAKASSVDAKAYLGFVGIQSTGSTVDMTGGVGFQLTQGGNTRFTIGQLFNAIATGNVQTIVPLVGVTWSGGAVLNNLALDADLPGFTDLATALAGGPYKLGFKFDAGGLVVDGANTSLGALADFSALKFDSVLGALRAIVGFLRELEELAAFDQKIPVLNLSFKDLVGAADRFAKVVDDFERNPTLAVQSLQARLREALGLPVTSPLVSLSFDAGSKVLGLKFTVRSEFDQGLGVDVDLQDLASAAGVTIPPEILNLKGSARLETAGALDVTFNLGIDLATFNPADPLASIYLVVGNGAGATGAQATFSARGQDLNFNGAIGPVGLYINDGSATIDQDGDPVTLDPLRLGVAVNAPGDKLFLNDLGAASLVPIFEGGVGARLPVFFPTESNYLGDIRVGVGNLAQFFSGNNSSVTFEVPDLTEFASGNFSLLDNLRMIVEGVDLFLGGLEDLLSGELFGFSLPLVGDALGDAVTFVQDLRTNIVNKVRQALNEGVEQAVSTVTNALTSALGAGGLNILRGPISTQGDPTGTVTPGNSADDDYILWVVPLGSDLVDISTPLGFNLGLPGLGLEAEGDLEVKLGWSFDFAFGLDLENGFFLDLSDTDPVSSDGIAFDPGKLLLSFEIGLPDAALTGKLAFLKLEVADDGPDDGADNTSSFKLDFTVDLTGGGGDGRLGLFELSSLGLDWDVTGDATLDLDLTATLNNDDIGLADGVFPGLVADFSAKWEFNKSNISTGGALTELAFRNIGLDLGSFLSDFLGPIVKEIQKVTEPFQPLIEVITTPIPVLSDLAGKPITLIDLAATFGELDAGFIYAIADLITLVNSIPTDADNVIITFFDEIDLTSDLASGGTWNPTSLLDKRNSATDAGDFVSSFGALAGAASGFTGGGGFGSKLGSSSASSGTKDFTNKLTSGGFGSGFSFPLLTDPTQLLGLLFGFNKDIILVEYDLPALKFAFEYSQFFPVWGPLGASITGSVSLTIDFAFGYDTFGIRRFAEGGYQYPLDIFRGFFIKDTADGTGTGTELPEITFELSLVGAAEINLGIASGGVGGGLRSLTYFDLNDPDKDGRVRIEELLNNLLLGFTEDFPVGPLSIFDVSGRLEAFLTAYIEFLFVEFETQIGPSLPILEYSLPLERPPVVATELGNGVLRLNMGPYAGDRLHRNPADNAEVFKITQLSAENGSYTVEIDYKGTKQRFSGVTRIVAEGGAENDQIDVYYFNGEMILDGGAGDDRIQLHGTGPATILGGTGDDTLIGGSSADSIDGGSGNDSIRGAGSGDTIRGGDGNDTIFGEDGDDVIYGEADQDSIEGGLGKDFIDGGSGNDVLLGNDDDDTITGAAGRDTIQGGAGADSLGGGADSDSIAGGDGADQIWGDSSFTSTGAGVVTRTEPLTGSEGNDTIAGEAGDDSIYGERGNDLITGGLGADSVEGGFGADTIYGNEGNDTLKGDADGDQIYGNGGADLVEGNAGNDILFGDDGEVARNLGAPDYDADDLTIDRVRTVANPYPGVGDAGAFDGDDSVHGGAGDDSAFGGGGNDRLFGDVDPAAITPATNYTGLDLLVGDYAQVDYRFRRMTRIVSLDSGIGGNDTIHGSNGDDTVIGGAGKDRLNGGHTAAIPTTSPTDNDIVIGDSGELLFGELVNAGTPETSARRLTLARTIAPTDGDSDTIYGNEGDDVLFGGAAGDEVNGSTGKVIALGDNGEVEYAGGFLKRIETTDATDATGGVDTVLGKDADDILVGGVQGDSIDGNGGHDILVGDNVRIDFTAGVIDQIDTKDFLLGGADTITGDAGADTVLGGSYNDSLFGGTESDVILGDNGRLTYAGGLISKIETTDASGNTTPTGRDTINGDTGADTILGGADGDSILGNEGDDVILGDNGALDYQLVGGVPALKSIRTGVPNFGGSDTIQGNDGSDTILGGAFGDTIQGNAGNDRVLGDGGELIYNGGPLRELRTIDTNVGGIDTVQGNDGDDTILGGAAGDSLDGNLGRDLILGDNGELLWVLAGPISFTAPDGVAVNVAANEDTSTLDVIRTIAPNDGAGDTIQGNEDDDSIFGGTGSDTISGDTGFDESNGAAQAADLIFGDHGAVYPGLPQHRYFYAKDTSASDGGAGDSIFGNAGGDTILGQQGRDTIFGGDGDDDIVGGHNLPGGFQVNGVSVGDGSDTGDLVDAGRGRDVVAGDNAWMIRVPGSNAWEIFQTLAGDLLYTGPNASGAFGPNITGVAQSDPDGSPARAIKLLDHSDDATATAGKFGADSIAGGAGNDTVLGQLGNDSLHGDGRLEAGGPFNWQLANAASPDSAVAADRDGNDHLEGNGGDDTIWGGRGQDNILGGSSDFFGLDTVALRPDGSDTIYGGNGDPAMMAINSAGDGTNGNGSTDETVNANGHARDADVVLGDNGRIYRIVAGGTYRSFNYDGGTVPTQPLTGYLMPTGYGPEKIQVRAFSFLDYTPGVGATDAQRFGDDRIFGEAGDDTLHGMDGSETIYGDGQDDDIYGGVGHDWIHGGSGEDGVIGDDGLIRTSRNGLAESLYGIAAIPSNQLNLFIKTPGGIQQQHINIANQLQKQADIEPFAVATVGNVPATSVNGRPAVNSDDVIFGGLGNDSLHGGPGDDAISGAEAMQVFYDLARTAPIGSPLNAGNLLRFGEKDPQEFYYYDEYNALRRIVNEFVIPGQNGGAPFADFLLAFLPTAGSGDRNDGRDKLFGDLGNDWLVGGTNRDHLYGGFGNDLLDTDDNHYSQAQAVKKDFDPNANNTPDERADFFYADIAFGGGGRDVLMANTGKDRLIDWVGEFNSYLVPFAPYGMWTISRTMQPQLPEYLYALSKSDGADQSRTAPQTHPVDFPGGDPARNGEPYGELGLVKQQDEFWKAQTGAPDDPQAGNIPGGKRDEWKSESFSSASSMTLFAADTGSWSVKSGAYEVAATTGPDAVSVMHLDDPLPLYFEVEATVNIAKPRAGVKANGFIIFDYQSETNFKFAGIDEANDKVRIGQRTAAGWQVLATANLKIDPAKNYELKLFVNDNMVTLTVNGGSALNYTFANRLKEGLLGLAAENSQTRFDNVRLLVLPPNLAAQVVEDFNDGVADFLTGTTGQWQTSGGSYTATPELGGNIAVSTIGLATQPGAIIELSTTIRIGSQTLAGFVFDYQGPVSFKYAGYDSRTGNLVIGHRTAAGWFVDNSVFIGLGVGTSQSLAVTLSNSTVNVSLAGKQLSYTFNSFIDDGSIGLFSFGGTTTFDDLLAKILRR